MTKDEKRMYEAMQYAMVSQMPQEWVSLEQNGNMWVKAIARTQCSDGIRGWAVVQNVYKGRPMILKDFYGLACVVKFERIYPFRYCDSGNAPDHKDRKGVIKWIVSKCRGVTEKQLESLTDEQLDKVFWTRRIDLTVALDNKKRHTER